MQTASKYIGGVGLVLCLLLVMAKFQGGEIPNPFVESPFPAEGYWMLIASQEGEGSGVALVANSQLVTAEPDLQSQHRDYDRTDLPAPWQDALDWAKAASNGLPYFVGRNGNKAAEGPLTGSVQEMHDTISKALEELR